MNGIYGDVLLAFPEQRRSVTVYDMEPELNGGWTIVEGSQIKISAIYQNTSGDRIKEGNGNLVKTGGLELWTETTGLNGFFTKLKNQVYRLNAVNGWEFEAGYARYSLEKLVGNNGTESDNTTWNLGGGSFS